MFLDTMFKGYFHFVLIFLIEIWKNIEIQNNIVQSYDSKTQDYLLI